jgi:hypothetical protein
MYAGKVRGEPGYYCSIESSLKAARQSSRNK